MGRRSGLGKGLDALIPSTAPDPEPAQGELREIPVSAVRPNRYQPRNVFDDDALAELANSIRELGVLQPILVREVDDGFELIAGERRWRAAQVAGLERVPALVRQVEHQASLEQALVENLQREDLNPVEEALAYRQLVDEFGLSHDEVAQRVGRSRSAVSNTVRLLQLPPEVLELLVSRQLGAGHARALLPLPEAEQVVLARRVADEGWSVRRVEEEVKAREEALAAPAPETEPEPVQPRRLVERPAALLELEHLLSDHLDTRVHVQLSGRRGKVLIEFAGIEDLERIYRAMVSGREED